MAKHTASKKKSAHQASNNGGNNKSIFRFFYLPTFIAIIAIAASAYYLIRTQVSPVNHEHQQTLISQISQQYEAYFNNVLDQHDDWLEQIASSDYLIAQISNGTVQELNSIEQSIDSIIPSGLSVHIFPLRQAELQLNATPPFSHAAMDMVRRAEQGQAVELEAHQNAGVVYLQSVKAVRNNSGRIIGSISISQSIDYLVEQMRGIDPKAGNLLVQQQFANSPVQTLMTYGAKNNNEIINLSSNNPHWTLTFQPADHIVYAKIQSPNIFILVFSILGIACVLPIIFASQRTQYILRKDANTLARQVQNLLSKQDQSIPDFELAIFNSLGKTINRLRLGKGLKQASAMNSSVPETKYNPDGNESLDVSIMDSDDDLLGMDQPTNTNTNHIAVDETLFGTYDISGVVGQTLTNDAAFQIGLAVGSEAFDRGQQTIIVGRDGRISSPELAQSLIQGIRDSGRDVIDLGEVPTPVCYFACQHLEVDSCIVVTGSHNPTNHNGFKVVIAGNTLVEDEIHSLYLRIEHQNFLTGEGKLMNQDVSAAYFNRIKSDIKPVRALKVVVDCGNGVIGNMAPQLIKNIGCHVLPLYCDVDGNFPNHFPDPSDPRNIEDLARTVVETRADLGIAFDGDGDRIGIVTNSGKIVYADHLMMLLSKQVVQANPGATVLFDVKSSRRLKSLILGLGGKPIMWKTGHSFIKRKMKETSALLAGEMSGHIFYKDRWFGFDDGMYATARLIEIIAAQTESLDSLLDELPQDISTPEITIESSDAAKHRIIDTLQRSGNFGAGQLTDIDGLRVDFQNGWGLVRASNTSSKLSCRFEADSEEALRKIQTLFKQQLLAVDSQLRIPF